MLTLSRLLKYSGDKNKSENQQSEVQKCYFFYHIY